MRPVYKPAIFIAMPNMGQLAVGHTQNLLQWFLSDKYRLRWYPLQDRVPLDRARNDCHKEFMKDKYDYLLFLDADTVPPPNVIDRLLAAHKDMISATVQTLLDDHGVPKLIPVAYRWNEDDPKDIGYKAYWGKGIEWVDVTTCACTLIRRKVLEAVGPKAFTFQFSDEWGTKGNSEDFYFCERVREKGFKIWNHYGILCSHHKTFDTKTVNTLMVNARVEGVKNGW